MNKMFKYVWNKGSVRAFVQIIIFLFITYLGGSFISLTLNPLLWGDFVRIAFVVLNIVSLVNMNEDDKPN